MEIKDFDVGRHGEAVKRMWVEAGWGEYKEHERVYIEASDTVVAEVGGEAVAVAVSSGGDMQYLKETLPIAGVGAVITDLVARKQRLSSRLAAWRVAEDARAGALVSGLGAFEDGYYNRLGFGTGGYEHVVSFAPSSLKVKRDFRPPRRLGKDDVELVHAGRLGRCRDHGACSFLAPEYTRLEMGDDGFGFGYVDDQGRLTHHLMLGDKGKEEGPFGVRWLAYENWDQFYELLALLKSFGDQFHLVTMADRPGFALQDWLERPFYYRRMTRGSKFEHKVMADAWWQMRVLDVGGTLDKTRLPGANLRFNLQLDDPIEAFLPEDAAWRGVGGDYVVTLGPQSGAEKGVDPALPTLKAGVGAWTRLWLGAHPASRLARGGQLQGPPELIEALDWTLRLPEPWPEWEF